jgi:hypothetical protein
MGIGKMLIILGGFLMIVGVLFTLPLRLGHLPGDLVIRGKNSVFYFPVVTCLLLSALLTLIFSLFGRR